MKKFSQLVLLESIPHQNPSSRAGPQDLLVRLNDCEKNQQKTLNKYAINQVIQCESGTQDIQSALIA